MLNDDYTFWEQNESYKQISLYIYQFIIFYVTRKKEKVSNYIQTFEWKVLNENLMQLFNINYSAAEVAI